MMHISNWAIINFKEIKAGNEVLDNYLPMGEEEAFKTTALELRKECSNVLGLVEQYQKNATKEPKFQPGVSL